ncbi:Uncharacterized conserved protein YutE, UPF0331/DUF86 family [Salinibacillus kushneri]|uniref:Uncharacterized conserved protein YutE, UPF0331/DUF86 family n=1 Tax=Salinibacillus kushneri TaxID=237682 RepID=A0A1H9Y8J9_9BACI|nr:DUF86 domain-containing protein [Salinibacillus kushneri]SES65259.1 Uncharacterized conserved protein YutE, UPF0331/DUF86 family [Salinibacillus kushneri]
MYFVDRDKIERTLLYVEGVLQQFQQNQYETFVEKMALERMTQTVIEAIIDVGNMMIDGFIMRDPGSYEDIIDILVDEKVLPAEEQNQYKEVFQLRKTLVREYLNVDHEKMERIIRENLTSLSTFSDRVRTYLENELGPVTAFSRKADDQSDV